MFIKCKTNVSILGQPDIRKKTPFTPMILKFYKSSVKFFFLKFEATNK